MASVKGALIILLFSETADGCPRVPIQVDISRQLGAQRYLAVLDLICKPRQLCTGADKIRIILRTAAGGRLGHSLTVPLFFLWNVVGLYGHL